MLYRTYFKLTSPVNDFDEARKFLTSNNMTKYLLKDTVCSHYKDKILSIKWILVEDTFGYIDLETSVELNDRELEDISEWVSSQNSDGIGADFEQEDFAISRNPNYLEGQDNWESEYNLAGFDWQVNAYHFEPILVTT